MRRGSPRQDRARTGRTSKKAQRAASERALVAAFDGLFRRHGAAGLGVNVVLAKAGVGKRLLYEYFGDLNGLAAAWARDREDPLQLGRRRDGLLRELRALRDPQRVAAVVVDYATALRGHPWAAQVLLTEIQQHHGIGPSLRSVRREIGSRHERLLVELPSIRSGRDVGLAFVLHAAAQYLALRAKFAPDYNGLDLKSAQGWDAAMRMLVQVASRSAGGRIRSSARRSSARGTRAPRAPDTRAATPRSSATSLPKRAR